MDDDHPAPRRRISRRALLGLAGLGAAGGAVWVVGPERIADVASLVADGTRDVVNRPVAVASSTLTDYRELAGSALVYEVDGARARFPMEDGFARQLDASLRSHWGAAGWGTPAVLTSYGTWRAGPAPGETGTSWHHAARAFDVGTVKAGDGTELVSCRYDLWATAPDQEQRAAAYWRLAATLHRDFEFVLTYLYDDAHHNHIHVDNGRSGSGTSTFRRTSRVQVQAVQAMCRHVWGRPVDVTGHWDRPTRNATSEVLDQLGVGGALTAGQKSWQAFLSATAAHPAG